MNSGQSADHNSALQHQQALAKLFGTPQDQQAKTLELGLKSGQLDINKTLAALYQQFTQTKNEDQKLHLAGLIHLMRGTNSEKNFQSHVLPEGTEAGPDGQLVKKPGGVVTTDLRNGETKIITQPRTYPTPTADDITRLKEKKGTPAQFEAIYGPGSSASLIGK